MRITFVIAAASIFVAGSASAKTWSVDCAAGACVAVDLEGNIAFIDLEKQTVTGVDKLASTPEAPVTISCSTTKVGEGCVVVDGTGKMWFGPIKPGTPYKPSENKLP